MKKILFFMLFACFGANSLFAQQPALQTQGHPRPELPIKRKNAPAFRSSLEEDKNFTFDSIAFWVGTGEKRAALVIDWYDGKGRTLVWGYRWDGTATGFDMIAAIAKADPRFLFFTHYTGPLGSTIAGFGYDLNNSGNQYLIYDGDTANPFYPDSGIVTTDSYNYDSWESGDPADHWQAGWYEGYWSYQVKDYQEADFSYSGWGASSRQLADGSWDGWGYQDGWDSYEGVVPRAPYQAAKPPVTAKPDYTQGVFFVNEDWFGHQNSTLNFLKNNGEWVYDAYSLENPGKELGATSQYGTIYGGNFYIVSKQDKDPGAAVTGSRLAVCDAGTLESLKEFPVIGENADGRSFLGVNEHKGYIGTSNGIWIYDIDNKSITKQLENTGSGSGSLYLGQTGTMLRVGDRVFAVNQQNGVWVIDAQADTIQTIITAPKEGSAQRGYGSIVQSKDGNLWLSVATNVSGSGGAQDYMIKLNPWTLDTVRIALPAGYAVPNSWYAWTADGFCSSKQENKVYWKNDGGWFAAQKIYAYDIANDQTELVYDLADYDDGGWGFYGAAFRIDPVSDAIYAFVYRSFGEAKYRTVRLNPATKEITTYPMTDHYWFPALPVFPDNADPVVSEAWTDISLRGDTSIYLGDKVSDADNLDAAIVKSILPDYDTELIDAVVCDDSLIIKSLKNVDVAENTTLTLKFNSNGRIVTGALAVTVEARDKSGLNEIRKPVSVYPNPFAEFIVITAATGGKAIVYDLSGKVVLTVLVNAGTNRLNTTALNKGVYVLKMDGNTVKIVK